MNIVSYEPQKKYNRTPVSIQDKFLFCYRAPMGIENGKFNAVFLTLATEYVQYIIRFILKATQTLDTCACHVLLYLLNCKKNASRMNTMIYVIFLLILRRSLLPCCLTSQLMVGSRIGRAKTRVICLRTKYLCHFLSKIACEQQTHFRSSLLSLRKIASTNPSGKTISLT